MFIIKKNTRIITTTLAIVISGIAAILGWTYLAQQTSAADMSKFDPGNIMSDAVMSNKDSMGVQQIQAFLNSKNACNNTNTYMASWYPHLQYTIRDGKFVCMAQDTFNGKSAAQIIWQVGQDYGINPQFLIVLLEKEQGLVTDTWPNHVQYRSATGFGCPDTAACDSKYFGLENQLINAASLFRTVLNGGWSNYPVGWTYVQYHPNTSCGGKVINIQNRATSALYRYTPYQPNQSAINAGYGLGDSCGAYGNRNTWALFTDWFGSSQGYIWQQMEESRWMQIKTNTQKIDLNTGNKVDGVLPSGQQLKFIDKTTVNGVVYLRTEWDYNYDIAKGVPLSSIIDIEYVKIKPEWRMVNLNGVHKYLARQHKWVGLGDPSAQYPLGIMVKVVDSITVNGQVSYRTEFDSIRNIDLTFAGDRLSAPGHIQELEPPRNMQIRANTTPTRLDGAQCDTLRKHETIYLEGKAIINGALYFSDKKSTPNSDGLCFINPNDTYWGVIEFSYFDHPREMKLKKDTKRIDAYTGEIIDILKAGRVIHFSTKTTIGKDVYFRTTYSSERDEPYVLPASAITEI